MTGSDEIEVLCNRIRKQFDPVAIAKRLAKRAAARERGKSYLKLFIFIII